MRVVQIVIERTVQTAPYESRKVQLTAVVDEGDDHMKVGVQLGRDVESLATGKPLDKLVEKAPESVNDVDVDPLTKVEHAKTEAIKKPKKQHTKVDAPSAKLNLEDTNNGTSNEENKNESENEETSKKSSKESSKKSSKEEEVVTFNRGGVIAGTTHPLHLKKTLETLLKVNTSDLVGGKEDRKKALMELSTSMVDKPFANKDGKILDSFLNPFVDLMNSWK